MTDAMNRRATLGAIAATDAPSRRLFLAAGSATAVFLALRGEGAAMAEHPDADAEILALAAEVLHRYALADALLAARINPFEERFEYLLHDAPGSFKERYQVAFAYSRETGREAAIEELDEFDAQTDDVYCRMMAIPAKTQPGRAAKVRALLVHVMGHSWRGPGEPLDWPKEQARALLGEFAGMTADELAAI